MPSNATLIGRALALRCAWCGGRAVVRRWLGFAEACPTCGLRTERIAGHWIGAVGINVIVSFTTLFAVLLIGTLAAWPQRPPVGLAIGALTVAIALPLVLVPWSRTLWMAIDLRLRPPEERDFITTGASPEQPDTSPGADH